MADKPLTDEQLDALVAADPGMADAVRAIKEARDSGQLPDMAPAIRSGTITDMNTLLDRLYELPPCRYIDPAPEEFRPREGRLAEMHTAVLTDAESACPIAGTAAIAPCMGVAIFNTVTRAGGVVHVAENEDGAPQMSADSRNALTALLAAIRTDPAQTLEVRILGPIDNGAQNLDGNGLGGRGFISDAVGILNAQPNLLFLSADFMGKSFATAFALDTRRWEEGLIKGSATIYRLDWNLDSQISVQSMRDDASNVVETVDTMPPGSFNEHGLCDMRGVTPSPPKTLKDDDLDRLAAADPSLQKTMEILKAARREGKLPE